VQNFWKDPKQGDVCPGKPWAERWVENKARCNAKNGIAPTPAPTGSAPAPAGSEATGNPDEDELLKAMMGGGAASAAPSGSASAAPSGSAAPAASGSAAPGGEDDLLKDMLK
jgi:hypothetical protein